MSSLVRIRLSFQRSLSLAEIKNCWFLVDTSKCSTIADLEYLIKKRFGELSKAGSSVSLNLYLEDYLLPSQEKIEVIQQNDNIRVELNQITTKESSEESESEEDTGKKVNIKQKNSSLPDARIKSRKTASEETSLASTSFAVTKCKSSKPSKETSRQLSTKEEQKPSHPSQKLPSKSNPSKRKNTAEPLKTNAKKSKASTSGMGKDFVANKNAVDSDSSSLESSSSTESSSDGSGTSMSTNSHCKASAILNGTDSAMSKTTKGQPKFNKPQFQGGSGKIVQDKSSSAVALPKGKKGQGANLIASKTMSVLQGKNKGKSTAATKESSSSSSSSAYSETEESETESIKDSKNKELLSSSASSLSTSLQSSTSLKSSCNETEKLNAQTRNTSKSKSKNMIKKANKKRKSSCSPFSSLSSTSSPSSPSSSSENQKDTYSWDSSRAAETLPCMNSLSSPFLSPSSVPVFNRNGELKDANNTTLPLLSPSLSSTLSSGNTTRDTSAASVNQPVTINIHKQAKPTRRVNAVQQTSRAENGKPDSSLSVSHIRFDSEDETMEGQEGACLIINDITDDFNSTQPYSFAIESKKNDQSSSKKAKQKEVPQRDYSLCTPLHGPPRSGDKIAYKVLELSASYTPEVSSFKEGTVQSYDPSSGNVNVELTKDSLKKTIGDGNVTRKFELVYDEDEDNEENTGNEEVDTEVIVPWSSMLDPVLISD